MVFALAAVVAAGTLAFGAEPPAKPVARPPAVIKPRFEVKDRDWPSDVGAASICLWKDDAQAALSITIDDNTVPDHPWWFEMGKKYDLKFTWFVITDRITRGENPSFNQNWDYWKKVVAMGHDVQSHTKLHGHTDDPDWKNIDDEYATSKKQIETGIPGHKVLTVAFFGGPNSNLNDPAVAAKYYIGARGTRGSLNAANAVNYAETNSVGADINMGDARFPSQDLNTTLVKGKSGLAQFYRGWYCSHFHGVNAETRAKLEKRFAAVKELVHKGEIWPGLFTQVIQYGKERDTAELTVSAKDKDKIVFAVTDKVDDATFDFPLTVKVHVDSSWKSAKATQAGKEVGAKLVDHDGAKFVLVQAVPDRGDITLERK
jgi:hypothetical protein